LLLRSRCDHLEIGVSSGSQTSTAQPGAGVLDLSVGRLRRPALAPAPVPLGSYQNDPGERAVGGITAPRGGLPTGLYGPHRSPPSLAHSYLLASVKTRAWVWHREKDRIAFRTLVQGLSDLYCVFLRAFSGLFTETRGSRILRSPLETRASTCCGDVPGLSEWHHGGRRVEPSKSGRHTERSIEHVRSDTLLPGGPPLGR
jgi:hypothetical protein